MEFVEKDAKRMSLENFLGFLTTLSYSLKEVQQLYIIENHIQCSWKRPTLIFRRVGTSWVDWSQNPKEKMSDTGGVVLEPVLLE